jgi:cytochrome c551/c552
MKTKVLIILALFVQTTALATPPEEGKTIFMNRCASCHNVNKQIVGPALAGIDQRRSLEWIIQFVRSSQTAIKNGDTAALAVFQKFNKVPMPDHSDLSETDIKSIVEFIKTETKTVGESKAPFAKPGKKMSFHRPLSLEKDLFIFLAFFVVVLMLISAMLFAVRMNEFKRQPQKDPA